MVAHATAAPDGAEIRRFRSYLSFVGAFTGFFGVVFFASGLVLHSTSLIAAALLDLQLLWAVYAAARLMRRGRLATAACVVSYALIIAAAVGAPLAMFLFPTLAIIPILAVAFALPYLNGRRLWFLSIACLVASGEIAVLGAFSAPLWEPFWLKGAMLASTLVAAVFLALLQLYYYNARIHQTLHRTRSSEERFRTLATASSQVVWTADAEGVVREDSPSWRAFTGQTLEEYRGWGWLDAVHPDDRDLARKTWARAVTTRTAIEIEYRLRRADGTYSHVAVHAAPVRTEEGKVREWIGMNFDVTARKEAEEALKDANRRKDEFLATLGHELRNPLAPMLTAVELLKTRDGLREPGRKLEIIDRQVRQMVRLVDDLLDVSRISRGKIQLKRENVDLSAIVIRSLESARPAAQRNGVEVYWSPPEVPLYVMGDPLRLEQIAINLLNNAVKFTRPGGHVWVSARPRGEWAVLSVRDDGVGIAAEALARVFEPFVQLERETGMAGGGLGIGLSLVRGLVELHGGEVTAESAGRGRGAQFTVRLPQSAQPPRAVAPADLAQSAGLRVLVVDDNADAAEMIAELIGSDGHSARVALDGQEALRIAAEFSPQVVLLDIGLPGMDGYETAERMRQMPELTGARLVALTGYGQASDRQRALASGFDAHLVKPVDWEALRAVLEVSPEVGAGLH